MKSYINTIINTLPGAVYWKDKNGCYLGCNKFVASMAGFDKPQHILGKTDFDLCWSEFAQEWRDFDLEVMREQKTYKREESVRLADGRIITEITIKSPLYNEKNEVVGIIGTSMDITEQKILEQDLIAARKKAEAANQAKTEFLSNMRHDIRTPLSGILGFSEILKLESNEPRIKEYADNLVASSHALLHLMDEVLDAVKIGSGEIPRLKRKFDLIDTLEQVILLYEAKACERKLKLSLSMDKEVPRYVIGDKIRVHRIVLELIGNALNFTEEGFVTLNVELAKKEHRHLVLRIHVADSGIGIAQEKQQEIYLQFKRLTPSYQGIYKGAGLGLYVVKQFIEELEGEIYVESEPRKGTVFTCLIPLQEPLLDDKSGVENGRLTPPNPLLTPIPVPGELSTPSPEAAIKHKILVVEDNFIAQTVAKSLLGSLQCRVDIAANGLDAIALCKETDYDLIFMDIGLGEGMDGYEVTQYIRSQINSEHHIPIIALTAHGADESKQRCIESGMDAVLTKPLTQNNAAEIINSFIPSLIEKSPEPAPSTRRDLPDNDEELFHLNQFSLLDEAEALRNCATLDTVRSMLELLHQELPKDLAQMKQAFAEQNFPLVEQIAHKIKGGAVYLGTHRMKYACQYVERYWKAGERTLFSALYQQAITVIEETQTYIEGWLRTH